MEYCVPLMSKHHLYIYGNEEAILSTEKKFTEEINSVIPFLKYTYTCVH